MAATLHYFMLPEDERALFHHLARRELTTELLILQTRIAKSYDTLLARVR